RGPNSRFGITNQDFMHQDHTNREGPMDRNVQGGERDARPHRKTLLRTHEWVLVGATQNLPMSSESSIATPDFFEDRRGETALNSVPSTEIRAPSFLFPSRRQ